MFLAVLDTETTGIDPDKAGLDVIEIACSLYCTKTRTILKNWSSLMLPLDIPEGSEENLDILNPAQEVNGIKPLALCSAPVADADLSFFIQMLEQSDVIVAHNAEFDRPRIIRLLEERGAAYPERPWACTMKYVSFPNQRNSKVLTHLCSDHEISTMGAHRAMSDVLMLCSLLAKAESLDEQILEAIKPRRQVTLDKAQAYDWKDRAKKHGFWWDGDKKTWFADLTDEQIKTLREEGYPIVG